MKPIAEGMGLNWKTQYRKLAAGRFASTMVMMTMVAQDGKAREMACLPLHKLAGWLMSIHPAKVREPIRESVIAYQSECDDVLWAYWNDGLAVRHNNRAAEVEPANPKHDRYELNPHQGALRGELVFNYKGHAIRVLERETGWLFCLDDMVPAWTSSRSPARVDQMLWRVPERDRVAMRLGGQSVVMLAEGPVWSLLDRLPETLLRNAFAAWFREDLLPRLRQLPGRGVGDSKIGTDGFHILRELIGKKVKVLPAEVQRSAQARLFGALHTRFNVPKAELIDAEDMAEACRFVAQWTIEGEFLPASRVPATELPDLNYPLARWRAENPHLKEVPGQPGVLGVSVMALNPMDTRSPTRHLFGQVEAAGFDVEACKVEFNAMRDHLDVLHGVLCQYQSSMQTMSQRRFGYRLRQAG